MKEYNALTKQLLEEGYTVGNHPDYVRVCSSRLPGDDPLNNMAGGFEYLCEYQNKFVYKTGCGKYVMGKNVFANMSYMGVDWTHENDCPVIRCPYDKPDCDANDERLHGISGFISIQCWCVCHRTDESYIYENSIEKANKERHDEMERKYEEFSRAHNGRVCRNHMIYNERIREWDMHYNPQNCASMCYSKNYCPILGRPLDLKKGNVYYDVKITRRRYDLDGTLFEGQIDTEIIKGNRRFERPVSIDICKNYVKLCEDDLIRHVNMKYHRDLFFAEYHGRYFKVEVLNIRAEQKESRDLIQDLQDIRDGIRIHHASDDIKRDKEQKSKRIKERKEKNVRKLERKILEVGYENLKEYSIDRIHADKWLSPERIEELEEMRKQKIREEQEQPVQLNLFDPKEGDDR